MKLPSFIFDTGRGQRIPEFTSSSPMITLHGQFNIKGLSDEIHVRGVCPQREHKFNNPPPQPSPERFPHSDLTEEPEL